MWLDDHAVKQADENVKQAEEDVKQAEEDAAELACEDPVKLAKLMRMKRHSRARNDIQYENCGVVLLMWDLLLEYLTGIEIAIESLEGLRRDVIACLRSKFIKAAVRARAQVFVNLLHLLRVLTKHNTINSSMLDMGELHLPILDKAVRDGANGMSKMSTRGLYLFEHCKLKQIVEKFRSSKMGVLDVVFGTEEEELVVRFHQAHMLGVLVDREKRYRNFFGDQLPAGYGHPQGKFFESTGPLRVTLSASRPDSDIVEGSFALFTQIEAVRLNTSFLVILGNHMCITNKVMPCLKKLPQDRREDIIGFGCSCVPADKLEAKRANCKSSGMQLDTKRLYSCKWK